MRNKLFAIGYTGMSKEIQNGKYIHSAKDVHSNFAIALSLKIYQLANSILFRIMDGRILRL